MIFSDRVVEAPTYEAWRRARHERLTASDVASVMGIGYTYREAVMRAKLGPLPKDFSTSAMRGGSFLEAGIFAWFLDDLRRHAQAEGGPPPLGDTCRGLSGQSLLVAHPDVDAALAASPDGLVTVGDEASLVEVKCTNPDRWPLDWGLGATKIPRAWLMYSTVEPPSYGKCPLKHWVQLQTQLLCTGVDNGYIVGNCGTKRLDFPFPADHAFQASILKAARNFRAELLGRRNDSAIQ
jgi:hypothetical protein